MSKKYWDVRLKAPKVGELLLYGEIANAQTWGDEVTPTQIDSDLKLLGELDTLNVRINSPGGSVFAGQAIHAIIKRHSAKEKNAYVDGLAASMATIIPGACHKTYMVSNGMMMIHRPYGSANGNADQMRQRADLMDKIEDVVLDMYAEKTGMDKEKIKGMLAAETWMNAKEALEFGFIDEIEQETKIAASIDGDFLMLGDVKIDTTNFKNFKPEIVETYREEPPQPVVDKPNEEPETPNLSAQNAEFNALRLKLLGGQ